ncbi:hypothetical protein [Limnohabitans sp.]|uniref:hypothetical protein n=1 Tax=Limnohabitans sp. TaxID=1907725 RepID=UPI0025C336FB|nr:hypothetical protein [Limnohabitans sp.]
MQNAHQKHGKQDNTSKQKAYPTKIAPKKTKNQETGNQTDPGGQVLPVRHFIKPKRDNPLK